MTEQTTLTQLQQGAVAPRNDAPMSLMTGAGFDQLQRVAKALCASTLVPAQYRAFTEVKDRGRVTGHTPNPAGLPNCVVALNMAQRMGADPLMGDGAGILVQIPDRFFREEMAKQGVTLPKAGEYAVGHIFMPQDEKLVDYFKKVIGDVVAEEGQVLLGFRDVPVDNSSLSKAPEIAATEPRHVQVFIGAGRIEDARKLIDEVQATDLSGVWSERAGALRAGLPAAPVVAEAAAPAADGGADLKLNLSGAK